MAQYYRTVTLSVTAPAANIGDIWIEPVASLTYQAFMYIDGWKPLIGGGSYVAESTADTHYINVVIQEDQPNDVIQLGWIWIKYSTKQAWIWLNEYVPLVA